MAADDTDFGPNVGLVEEIYRQWQEDPTSVSESWQDFFADYKPRLPSAAPGNGESVAAAPPEPVAAPAPAPPAPAATPTSDGSGATPLRGAAALIVKNMEASLAVPTATSARVVPAGLLEVNRRVANNYLVRIQRQGKVSFTHLIGWAIVRGLQRMPVMNTSYSAIDGKPGVLRHPHVNLGLAVDVAK